MGVTCRKTQAAKNIFMYKTINGLVPTYVPDLIPGEISTYTLRNQHDITVSRKSCIPSFISAWNSMNTDLRNEPSLASSK